MARTAPSRRRPPASSRSRKPPAPPPKRGFPVWPFVIGLVVLLGLAVVVIAALSGGDEDAAGDGGATPVEETAGSVEVEGDALPAFEATEGDAALGMTFPTMSGTGLDGEPLTIAGDGPTLVMFVAHWCPHCQREVPVVQDWVDAGNLPDGVELVTVSTSIDPSRPNYPPSAWLADEGWTAPTLVDPDDAAAVAAGLSAYPYFVVINADGEVVARTSGELTTDQLDQLVELAQG